MNYDRFRSFYYLTKCFIVGIEVTNPCVPSPCGPNSECRVIGHQAACSCLSNYIGRVPNCRPECTIDAECPSNAACLNEQCKDPCQGACGLNALCVTVNHKPMCSCQQGFTGDASKICTQIIISCMYIFFLYSYIYSFPYIYFIPSIIVIICKIS